MDFGEVESLKFVIVVADNTHATDILGSPQCVSPRPLDSRQIDLAVDAPAAHLINLDQNQAVIVLQVHLMRTPHECSHLLDDIIPFHHVVVSYRCTNSKLLRLTLSARP